VVVVIVEKHMEMSEMGKHELFKNYNYNFLKSPKKTNFSEASPVKEVLLNLTRKNCGVHLRV